jgi:hypothetical protein
MRHEPTPARTPISRETRFLLAIIAMSLATLWLLAQLRFQERPVVSTPLPPVLSQLHPNSPFEDLSVALAGLRPRLAASIVAADGPVLRIERNLGVRLVETAASNSVLAWDPASGLAVVALPEGDVPALKLWAPSLLDYPRYLVAADVSLRHVSLRPVFVGTLVAQNSPIWSGPIWTVPETAAVVPGTFVFTTEGALAGLAVSYDQRVALVPAETIVSTARRLMDQRGASAGTIGISVQKLSPEISQATGITEGVIVTWVDEEGPAAGMIQTADVIEAVDNRPMTTESHWRARIARLHPDEIVALQVRRQNEILIIHVASAPVAPKHADISLGLRLRPAGAAGIEVVSVQPHSVASIARMMPRDLITRIGSARVSMPAQLLRAFDELSPGSSLLLAITRDDGYHVVALRKP